MKIEIEGKILKINNVDHLTQSLTLEELEIVKNLKDWRSLKAYDEGLPAYMILSNLNIFTLAKYKPHQIKDLRGLKGFGEKKTERYGDDLIALLNSF